MEEKKINNKKVYWETHQNQSGSTESWLCDESIEHDHLTKPNGDYFGVYYLFMINGVTKLEHDSVFPLNLFLISLYYSNLKMQRISNICKKKD